LFYKTGRVSGIRKEVWVDKAVLLRRLDLTVSDYAVLRRAVKDFLLVENYHYISRNGRFKWNQFRIARAWGFIEAYYRAAITKGPERGRPRNQ